MKLSGKRIAAFKKTILDAYAHSGRSFPWRGRTAEDGSFIPPSPWGVVVSEFMLQQTQTGRVISYWERWMKKWPRPADLAACELQTVLREWSGLGYNRRAKNLLACAAALTEQHGGEVPSTVEELLALPGIGPYTAGAVAAFAFNIPSVFIETNIRSVLIHFFFQDTSGVADSELFPILEQTLDRANPRLWYWALMDYGAELKKLTRNPNRRSAHYTRQSRFEGSFRQIRGALVKTLSAGPRPAAALRRDIARILPGLAGTDYRRALESLEKEMFVAEEEGVYRIKNSG
ncbi:MAG: A/G-specific adenine glycosylase [Treponema sp.]|jgi:A/G-specific adenine glycosylase|nr:A/G-specific adenine glycosylase [Treponema sp.]